MIDSLRKDYGNLTTLERTSMILDATVRNAEEAVTALRASTPAGCDMQGCALNMSLTASWALSHSMRNWIFALAAMTSGGWFRTPKFTEAERQRLAWILALDALDKETGAACITMTDMMANGYASDILQEVKEEAITVDFITELETLRKIWNKMETTIQ
jgi:hypothetical protein